MATKVWGIQRKTLGWIGVDAALLAIFFLALYYADLHIKNMNAFGGFLLCALIVESFLFFTVITGQLVLFASGIKRTLIEENHRTVWGPGK